MAYGCQTWSLNKHLTNKLTTAQRAMEMKMLGLKLQDKIPCSQIRKRTKIIDIIEYTLKQKRKWAGHIARPKDNRWANAAQNGNRGEGRDQEGDHAEDGKTTYQGRREPPGTGKQQTEGNGRRWWRATSCSGWTKPRWKVKGGLLRGKTWLSRNFVTHVIERKKSVSFSVVLRERERERETDRQTDRQRQSQTDGDRGRERWRERGTNREREGGWGEEGGRGG